MTSTTDTRAPLPFVVALDGPAASGKGTLARRIAEHFGFAHLDTGVLYRGVARLLLDLGEDPSNETAAEAVARSFSLDQIKDADIRAPAVSTASSIVAANPAVRAALLDFQRRFAAAPPLLKTAAGARAPAQGAVLDGRDIGTVICPDAPVKLFVTASAPVRAQRRWAQEVSANPELTKEEVLADIEARDARDAARASGPLVAAEDAELLDTTDLTIHAVFAAARRIIQDELDRRGV